MKGSLEKSLLLLRITIICPVFSCAAVSPSPDNSHRFSFNPDFLQLSDGDNAKNIDLNYFASASGAAPGEYNVDVVMNGELVDRQIKIDFFAQDNKLNARLTPQQLDRWGVDTGKLSTSNNTTTQQNILQLIEGASENFDTNNQKLILNIPQSYLKPQDWLSTPPHLWDEGVPALMVNYLFNGIKQNNNGYGSRSQFLSLDSSLNLGGWRLRHNGNWSTN